MSDYPIFNQFPFQFADGSYLPNDPNKYTPHKSTRYLNINPSTLENKKNLPELYKSRGNCCGCTACYAICETQAISMLPDEEGFLYPTVNAEKCIRCYKCINVCAFKEAQKKKGYIS